MLASTNRARLVNQLEEIEKASYESGHVDGYLKALQLIRDFIDTKIIDVGLRLPEVETKPRKRRLRKALSTNGTKVPPPFLQRVVQYVREHPGTTATQAAEHVGGRYTLYQARTKGLIEKRGKQFYPLGAES